MLISLATLIATLMALPCNGQPAWELAKLPYATIHNLVSQHVKGAQEEEARFTIESSIKGVTSKDISIYIDSRKGRIPVKLNSDGTFSFPLRDDLLQENPFVVTNQPKGSMNLNATFPITPQFKFPYDGGDIRYSSLFVSDESFPQITKEVARVEKEVGITRTKTQRIFEFVPKNRNKGAVIIKSKKGGISIPPDADGLVKINYDPILSREDPWVTFPPAKEGWEPQIWMWVDGVPKVEAPGR
jgi:hypothetical protein